MCVRKACCPGLSESLFFFPFLTSHNPCFFPSLCRALPYIHMGPAILQAVAGQERTSIERYLLSFLVPCCRHLLCKLAKKRSGLSLVLHTNDSSTFIISSLWMAHISILHHFKNQSTLSPTPQLDTKSQFSIYPHSFSHHWNQPAHQRGNPHRHLLTKKKSPCQKSTKPLIQNFLPVLETLLLLQQATRSITDPRRLVFVFVHLARPQSLLVGPVLPRRFPRQQARPAQPERQFRQQQ